MSDAHDHGFEVPADLGDPEDRPVDLALLARFVGAGMDGCTTCQDDLITRIADDATITARLVELACVGINAALGGLPANLTDQDAPGVASPEFRRLASIGVDGGNTDMLAECERMTNAQRMAAAGTATDLLVGQLHMPVDRLRGGEPWPET